MRKAFSKTKMENKKDDDSLPIEKLTKEIYQEEPNKRKNKSTKRKTNNRITKQFYIKKLTKIMVKDTECALCNKKIGEKQFPTIINRALFRRYCSS